MFEVDESLIEEASQKLASRSELYWIIGGSCSGKTSLCNSISGRTGISVYDMDKYAYRVYMGRYSRSRHPASSAWFKRTDGLEWVLSLSWYDFNKLNRAVNAELLDLFSQDICENYGDCPLLVDGGITHPSVLTAVVEQKRIACISIEDAESRRIWETDESRSGMRKAIKGLPEGRKVWEKFLGFNKRMSETINKEAVEQGISVFERDPESSAEDVSGTVMKGLGI